MTLPLVVSVIIWTPGTLIGDKRFEIDTILGEGAFGVVYRALDRHHNQPVAVKALRETVDGALNLFKQEFRSLADLAHPNLARLYMMGREGDRWFIAMELVEGPNFLSHVRAGLPSAPSTIIMASTLRMETEGEQGADPADDPEDTVRDTTNEASILPAEASQRLQTTMIQLIQGLMALHASHLIHRDLKPANLLIGKGNILKILDFGLISHLRQPTHQNVGQRYFAGTPAYASPEQLTRGTLGPASDYYSLGVMLFEALTGLCPFQGSLNTIIRAKLDYPAIQVSSLIPDVEPKLDRLCYALMSRDAKNRPSPQQMLELLEAPASIMARALHPTDHSQTSIAEMIGRESLLNGMEEAYLASQEPCPSVVQLRGRSGLGKSMLIARFLTQLARTSAPLTFSQRCYEREAVPFKAIDGLVDAVAHHLSQQKDGLLQDLLPRHFASLAQLFPVLLPLTQHDATHSSGSANTPELRTNAANAFCELLRNLRKRQPLVIAIDDLQWGDQDSAAFLHRLLQHPNAPAILWIFSYRSEDRDDSPFLSHLIRILESDLPHYHHTDLEVRPLQLQEAMDLARMVLWRERSITTSQLESLVAHAGGHPLLLQELARYEHGRPSPLTVHGKDLQDAENPQSGLDRLLYERYLKQPPEARVLLELLVLAGRPTPLEILKEAAGLDGLPFKLLDGLIRAHLIRSAGTTQAEVLETYHDRVREAILERLDSNTSRAQHLALARVLGTVPDANIDQLAHHLVQGGERAKAIPVVLQAAKQATQTLAFNRATQLYQQLITLDEPPTLERSELHRTLGDALAGAGKGEAAAEAYLSAAKTLGPAAAPHEEVELQRLAAHQYLMADKVAAGVQVVAKLLTTVGEPSPGTPPQTLARIAWQTALLKLGGIRYTLKKPEEIDPQEALRVDVLWTTALGLAVTRTLQAGEYQLRAFRASLALGEPSRLAITLGFQATYLSAFGKHPKETARLLNEAHKLTVLAGTPEAEACLILSRGRVALHEGRFKEGEQHCIEAERRFRKHQLGESRHHYLTLSLVYRYAGAVFVGHCQVVARDARLVLNEAVETGNHYLQFAAYSLLMSKRHLMLDDVDGALDAMDQSRTFLNEDYQMNHAIELMTRMQILLYAGRWHEADTLYQANKPMLKASHLLQVQFIAFQIYNIRALIHLAAARHATTSQARDARLKAVELLARTIAKGKQQHAAGLAAILRGGIEEVRGFQQAALQHYVFGQVVLETSGMGLRAAAIRWRRGLLLGGERGSELVQASLSWAKKEGIRDPERFLGSVVPG